LQTNKKIVFLTGTRADFGKLKPLIEKIENSNIFDCFIFVTGMHTLSKHGLTYLEVQKQKYKNIFIYMNQTNTIDPDKILSNTITGFSDFIKEIKPDMIIIHGDRVEALAGATVGAFNNILVSHIEGGEVSGTIDEMIRHSITKLSHIHFVSNEKAKQRLRFMGEDENSIYVIGSPDIDIMTSDNLPSMEMVKKRYKIPFDKYGILIFHPITTELVSLKNQTKEVVSSVIESKKNFIVIYPNNDKGNDIIFEEYKQLKYNKNFKIYPSLRFEYFLTLLKNANFTIGNSSVGIRESIIYGIPSINVGTRQKNRTTNPNIINVESERRLILEAIKKIEGKKFSTSFEFGDGKSSKRFYDILDNELIWNIPIQKHFVDYA